MEAELWEPLGALGTAVRDTAAGGLGWSQGHPPLHLFVQNPRNPAVSRPGSLRGVSGPQRRPRPAEQPRRTLTLGASVSLALTVTADTLGGYPAAAMLTSPLMILELTHTIQGGIHSSAL